MTEAEKERAAVVAWMRENAISYERERWDNWPFWRLSLWGLIHPVQFGREYGWFKCLFQTARAIERREHLKRGGE